MWCDAELAGVRLFLPHVLTAAADIRAAMGQRDKAAAGFEAAGKLAQARVHVL